MRVLNGIFGTLLILFAAVQWNDPDGPVWMLIYGIGAFWCWLATLRPSIFTVPMVAFPFFACFAGAMAGMIYFWPNITNWWDIDVWWPEITGEPAREGMGMMVLVVCLSAAAWVAYRERRTTHTG